MNPTNYQYDVTAYPAERPASARNTGATKGTGASGSGAPLDLVVVATMGAVVVPGAAAVVDVVAWAWETDRRASSMAAQRMICG